MEKSAYYRFAGRDLGVRAAIGSIIDGLDKTADADPEFVSAAVESAESLAFNDEVVKRAHNVGVLTAYGQVLEAIEAGTPIEKIAEQLSQAIDAKVASAYFPMPASDEEATQFTDEMVKGAAEAIGSITGLDPASNEVLDAAIDLVSSSIEAQ